MSKVNSRQAQKKELNPNENRNEMYMEEKVVWDQVKQFLQTTQNTNRCKLEEIDKCTNDKLAKAHPSFQHIF